jgi:hypothetical protein
MTDDENPSAIGAAEVEEMRALFLRQAAGETAHDIQVIDAVLARTPPGQPDPHYRGRGRPAGRHLPVPRQRVRYPDP